MDRSTLAAAAQPEALRATLDAYADDLRDAGAHHHPGDMTSVRRATHAGHEIVVETTYTVTVDGRPFEAQLTVSNGGRVHYHGLPTQSFDSAVDLVKQAIDQFPDDFEATGPGGREPGEHPDDHDHGDGEAD